MIHKVTVLDIIIRNAKNSFGLDLDCIVGQQGIHRVISTTVNRPGLALNGQFIGFGEQRIQLFGRGEVEFLYELEANGKLDSILNEFFSHEISCCIISHCPENIPPNLLIEYCEKTHCPLLYSQLTSAALSSNLFRVLNYLFAPQEVFHGVFIEVHDLGVFIKGDSGMGKSEVALELIDKGDHRLIADDVVLMKRVTENTIIGTAPNLKQFHHNLEIRGLGFVNVSQIYGISSTLETKKVHLVVELKPWDESIGNIDRLDLAAQEKIIDMLGVKLPHVVLHIKAGRNVSLLIETAAIKHRLISMGYHGKENPYLW